MRLSAAELHARAAEARRHYARCDLCAHDCLVDRTHGPAGKCAEGDSVWLAGAGVQRGEELGGKSGLVLIGGCNLACAYCETYEFSLERRELVETPPRELAALLLDLQKRGAENANFVTPTHVMPALLEALAIAAEHGFALPVVWNCGGYESLAALELLDGVVDIYLPDAKYASDAAALELSGCAGYTAALSAALREMQSQTRTIVRHLVLPGQPDVMPLIAAVSKELTVNVMSQYRPVHEARRFPVLNRAATAQEVRAAAAAAVAAGLRDVLVDGRRFHP